MHNAGKIVVIATLLMIGPPLVVVATHWNRIVEMGHVDPATAKGYVLYFTAPG